jgi:hypothetical protein
MKISKLNARTGQTVTRRIFSKRAASMAILCLGFLVVVGWETGDSAAPVALVGRVASGRSANFVIDRRTYETVDLRRLPIGIFISTMSGLTALEELMRMDEFNNRSHEPGPDGIPDFEDERFIGQLRNVRSRDRAGGKGATGADAHDRAARKPGNRARGRGLP